MTVAAEPQFLDSSPLYEAQDWEGLRRRGKEEGYLFFKQLLPKEELLNLRRDMLGVVKKHGWLDSEADPDSGILNVEALNTVPDEAMRLDIGVSHEAYDDVQKLQSFHRLPHHPRLLHLYQGLFGKDVLVHPRHIGRMITPHPGMHPTPQHQDFPLIQGTGNTWTCWFPLGDCPKELGGLIVLRQSHKLGYVPIEPAVGAGEIAAQLCPGEDVWVQGEYEMGDVLTFPCHTIHKALKCQYKDRIRLSLDVRYQPRDEVVEYKSLLPHCDLSWEQIYKGWDSDDLKYYWRENNLKISPWDPNLMQPGRRIC